MLRGCVVATSAVLFGACSLVIDTSGLSDVAPSAVPPSDDGAATQTDALASSGPDAGASWCARTRSTAIYCIDGEHGLLAAAGDVGAHVRLDPGQGIEGTTALRFDADARLGPEQRISKVLAGGAKSLEVAASFRMTSPSATDRYTRIVEVQLASLKGHYDINVVANDGVQIEVGVNDTNARIVAEQPGLSPDYTEVRLDIDTRQTPWHLVVFVGDVRLFDKPLADSPTLPPGNVTLHYGVYYASGPPVTVHFDNVAVDMHD